MQIFDFNPTHTWFELLYNPGFSVQMYETMELIRHMAW